MKYQSHFLRFSPLTSCFVGLRPLGLPKNNSKPPQSISNFLESITFVPFVNHRLFTIFCLTLVRDNQAQKHPSQFPPRTKISGVVCSGHEKSSKKKQKKHTQHTK